MEQQVQQEQTKKASNGVLSYLMYLGIFLVIMGIIGLFIWPSFRHWTMESKLEPITLNYLRDGGAETQWIGDGYDYYVNVGYRGQNYRVNVSEGVYTGTQSPKFFYDASNDEVFEAGTGHTKVIIYCLVFLVVFIWLFVYYPIKELLKKKPAEPAIDATPISDSTVEN